jgi:hypothetical protein
MGAYEAYSFFARELSVLIVTCAVRHHVYCSLYFVKFITIGKKML